MAKDVWGSDSRVFQKNSFMASSFLHFFQQASYQYSKEDLNMVAVMARGIWLRRNLWVFEGKFISLGACGSRGERGLGAFSSLQHEAGGT